MKWLKNRKWLTGVSSLDIALNKIESSALFDDQYYACTIKTKFDNRAEAFRHWKSWGLKRRITPTPFYLDGYYLARYPDVHSIRYWGFIHFVSSGLAEGRISTPLFNPESIPSGGRQKQHASKLEFWISHGLTAAIPSAPFLTPIFLRVGAIPVQNRERILKELFSLYNQCAAKFSGLKVNHYELLCGFMFANSHANGPASDRIESFTKRMKNFIERDTLENVSHLFSRSFYEKVTSTRFESDVEALNHWFRRGVDRHILLTPHFDAHYYVEQNPDIVALQYWPFLHFIKHGQFEGRAVKADMPLYQDDDTARQQGVIPENKNEVMVQLGGDALRAPQPSGAVKLVPKQPSLGSAANYFATIDELQKKVASGDIHSAKALAHTLENDFRSRLELWGGIALSRYFESKGDHQKSRSVLRRLLHAFGKDPKSTYYGVLRLFELGLEEVAPEAFNRLSPGDKSPYVTASSLMLKMAAKDVNGVLTILLNPNGIELPLDTLPHLVHRWLHYSTGNTPLEREVDSGLLSLLLRQKISETPVLNARLALLFSRRAWTEVGLIFSELDRVAHIDHSETLLRRIEFYSATNKDEEAYKIYKEHFANKKLSKWEGIVALRLLSHRKAWTEAGGVLRSHLASGFGFRGAKHQGMRIVRQCDLYSTLIEDMQASLASGKPPEGEALEFYQLVEEEAHIMKGARELAPLVATNERSRSRQSTNRKKPKGPAQRHDTCLLMCSDKRYFLSVATFLLSFLGQSVQVACDIYVFLDKGVPTRWHEVLILIGDRFGRNIKVIVEEEFVPQEANYRIEYGFYSGGSTLSRAAYFRIYAAKFLLDMNAYRRAAYIDTDTVCRSSLKGLFEFDLDSLPLAARYDDISPEVMTTCTRNNLDPRKYFNSGVLVFDFSHKDTRTALDEAIRLSEQEPQRLLFHDQCALNIAFGGQVASLDAQYNFFLRPSHIRNGYIEDGAILHYLDKPKPWDVAFDRPYREEWRVWFVLLSSLIHKSLLLELYAGANKE